MAKITVPFDIDDSGFNTKYQQIQNKIRSLRETGPGGTYSQLAQQYRSQGDEQRARRFESMQQIDRQRISMSIQKDLEQRERRLERINRLEKTIQDSKSSEEVKASKLLRTSEMRLKTMSDMAELQKSLSGSLDGANQKTQTLLGTWSKILAAVGTAGATLQKIGDFRYFVAERPMVQDQRQIGVQAPGLGLRERAIQGMGAEDIIFAEERGRALQKTMDFYESAAPARRQRALGSMIGRGALALAGGYGGAKLGTALGAKVGAKAGAAIGTAFAGPVGTVIGGLGGAALGALGGGIIGGAGGLGLSTMGAFNRQEEAYYGLTGNQGALNQMTAEDAMRRFKTQEYYERIKDPGEYVRRRFFLQNKNKLLSLQRSTGMTDEELFGGTGYLMRGAGEFSFAQRAGMSGQMLAAGGGGVAAGQLNIMALQAQRSLGLTNAGQAMGRITSYLNTEESKEAFIKVLAQGVTIGLDDSTYREEQKDYFNQVTAIAQNLGSSTEMVAAGLAASLEGDISRRNVGFAAESFQSLSNILSQTTGVTAAARAGAIAREDMFQGIGGMSMIRFQNLKYTDLTKENPEMKRFYEMAGGKAGTGKDFEDFVRRRREISEEALFTPYSSTAGGRRGLELLLKQRERELSPEELTEFATLYASFAEGNLTTKQALSRVKGMGLGRIQKETKDLRKKAHKMYKEQLPDHLRYPIGRRSEEEEFTKDLTRLPTDIPFTGPLQPLTDKDKRRLGYLETQEKRIMDELEKKESEIQAGELGGMGKTVNKIMDNLDRNLERTIADRVKLAAFSTAIREGKDAVIAFYQALDKASGRKPSSGNNNETTADKHSYRNNNN